ncbi:hypothetical protein, partial [Brevibacterium aurantiacum]|uniref:hypothetical protein n=1 Tax=Brevibacterium aurantiacum TaxID=273384 RepID=UPI00196AC9D1
MGNQQQRRRGGDAERFATKALQDRQAGRQLVCQNAASVDGTGDEVDRRRSLRGNADDVVRIDRAGSRGDIHTKGIDARMCQRRQSSSQASVWSGDEDLRARVCRLFINRA